MIDTDSHPYYTEADLLRIAEETAKQTVEATLASILGGMNLDNFKEKDAHMPEGDTGMAKLKAKVGDTWITGNSVQQLVDKALQRKTEAQASADEALPTVQAYCDTYMTTFRAKGTIAENTRIGYLGYLKNHICPAMGDLRLNEVTADTVQTYINEKSGSLSVSTIKNTWSSWCRFLTVLWMTA